LKTFLERERERKTLREIEIERERLIEKKWKTTKRIRDRSEREKGKTDKETNIEKNER
jgi:hypothetical protein